MEVRVFDSIHKFTKEDWRPLEPKSFPFVHFEFLKVLEDSGSLGQRTGWSPLFLSLWEQGRLAAALILFVKTNSYGEYIFDFAWANAFESQGLQYYPKLVSAVPFTPATGPKLLLREGLSQNEREKISELLLRAALKLADESDVSSLHALFVPKDELASFERAGFFVRHSFQFHFENPGYQNFEEFLAKLRSKRRREILRERQQVKAAGLRIRRLTGEALKPEHATAMASFYLDTTQKMGGYSYLTPDFFKRVFEEMSEKILLVLAETEEGRPVAGALNYFGEGVLYGRHWGCIEDHRSLHFEVCYYQGIEFALEKGLRLFEAGAQGEHKFLRGFLPRLTYSAHHIKEPRLASAIEDFCQAEKREISDLFRGYQEHSPFSGYPCIDKARPRPSLLGRRPSWPNLKL